MKYILDIHVNWDTLPEYKCLPDLPTCFSEIEAEGENEEEAIETLIDKLSDEYGFCIDSVDYDILEVIE